MTQLEASLRTRDSEIERLHQLVSSAQAQEASTALRAAEGEETAKRLDTELGAMRSKLIQAENNTKVRYRTVLVVVVCVCVCVCVCVSCSIVLLAAHTLRAHVLAIWNHMQGLS